MAHRRQAGEELEMCWCHLRSLQDRRRTCGCPCLRGLFSVPQNHSTRLPPIFHAMGVSVLSNRDSALVYGGLPGPVHGAAPRGGICPLNHLLTVSLDHRFLLDPSRGSTHHGHWKEGPCFSPGWVGKDTAPLPYHRDHRERQWMLGEIMRSPLLTMGKRRHRRRAPGA